MSTSRQFNTPISLSSAALSATHNSNTVANVFTTGGNVGIGTTAPSSKLHLRDTGSVTLLLEADSDNVTETDVPTIQLRQDGGITGLDIGIDSNNQSYIDFNSGTNPIVGNTLSLRDKSVSRMIIGSSGNVGIGTATAPDYTFEVNGSVFLGVMPALNTPGTLRLGRQDTPTIRYHDLEYNTTTTQASSYMSVKLHDGITSTSQTEVMRLRADGNIGIGTTAPIYKLDVNGDSRLESVNFTSASLNFTKLSGSTRTALINIQTSTNTQNRMQLYMYGKPGDSNQSLIEVSSHTKGMYLINSEQSGTQPFYPLSLSINNTEYLTLATNGNIGIGTTAPSLTLSVIDSVNNNNLVHLKNSHTNGSTCLQLENANGNSAFIGIVGTSSSLTLLRNRLYLQSPTDTVFTVNGINTNGVLFIQTSGNVGIGTTAPAHKLDVIGTIDATTYTGSNIMISGSIGSLGSIDAGSQFLGQPNDSATAPSFSWTGDTNTGIYRPITDMLGFVTNGLERMRINTGGNVGINTTNPSALLDVANGSDSTGVNGGPQISLQYRSSSGGGFRHFIRSRHNAVSSNHNGNGVDFFLNNLNTATGSSAPGTGNVCGMSITANGVGIGTISPDWPLHITTNNGNYTWPASGYYFTVGGNIAYAGSGYSANNSILATGGITSNNGFYATSDIRIKKIIKQGINEINVDDIDKLTISKFEYIDKLLHGNDVKLGFIAQNVYDVVPEAVTIRKEFVPNIFKVTSISNGVINLLNHNLTVGTKIKIMIDEQDRNGHITMVTDIIDENHFCIEYELNDKTQLFVYGTEVDDFKELNYNHIFTLSVGAVQKLRQDYRDLEDKFEKLANFIQAKFPGELTI